MTTQPSETITAQLAEAKASYLSAAFDAAQAQYHAILAVKPDCAEAKHMLGLLAAQRGDYDKAVFMFREALSADSHNPALHNHLANVLSRLKQEALAEQHYRLAMESDPTYAYTYNNLANLLVRQEKFEEAISYYQLAIEKLPNYDDAYYNLGYLYLRLNELEQARINLGEVITHCVDEWRLSKVQYQLGHIALSQERFEEAGTHYQASLNLNQQQTEVRKYLGFVLLKLDRQMEAIRQFSVYLMATPEDVEVQYNLGVLLQRCGEYEQAFYHFQTVIKLAPQHAEAHNNLGVLCLKQSRLTSAIHHFQVALRLDPDNEALRFTLTALLGEHHPPRAPAQFIETLYDSYALTYDEHMQTTLAYQVPQQLAVRLKKLWPYPQGDKKILELGCGSGLLGAVLRPYAATLCGIDLSAAMLRLAKASG